jgi:hypothetical protein
VPFSRSRGLPEICRSYSRDVYLFRILTAKFTARIGVITFLFTAKEGFKMLGLAGTAKEKL